MSDSENKPEETRADDSSTRVGSSASDLTGRELGDFRLLRRLGSGGMAEVYLAEQTSLKRRVAVKILKADLADDPAYTRRFLREAQAAASLVHANIVQIYEIGEVDGLHYIAQEYVEGPNLKQWLKKNGPPDLSHALAIIRQVAAGLTKAAEYQIVHRDIKPENIMLTPAGEVKVADFGLARVTQTTDATELTQVGLTVGTPLYMSPEQVEGKNLDPRSDIYSLGVTCYQMLTGAPPFKSQTALGLAVAHLNKTPKPLSEVRSDLPDSLCRIVHRMLAKTPEERYQSAAEMLGDLRHVYAQHGEEDWPTEVSDWGSGGFDTPSDPHSQATLELQQLMKSSADQPRHRSKRMLVALAMLAAFVAGGMTAWQMSEPSLMADASPPLAEVPRQETPLGQWYRASRMGTEAGWLSVIEYYPDNEYFVAAAEKKLAMLYLRRGDFSEAMELFEKFSESKDDASVQAFGLAGKSFILAAEGKKTESAAILEKLRPISDEISDPPVRRLIEYAEKSTHPKKGPTNSALNRNSSRLISQRAVDD